MKNLTLGSLFSGSGGFELAGMLAGITPVWNSEIEPYPILVTHNRLPDVQHFGDVSKLNGAELPPVDIVTFGSPCQDMSVAGKRNGLDGSRSGLFHEAVRIIREMRCTTNGEYPRFIVWENVCFDEDTLITCENGCKHIKDICIGDKVKTHTGKYQPVVKVCQTKKQDVIKMSASGGEPLIVTPNHPFLARKKIYSGNSVRKITEPEWTPAENLTKNHLIGYRIDIPSLPDDFISEAEAWAVGRWIADGSVDLKKSNPRMFFSIGKGKEETARMMLEKLPYTVYENKPHPTATNFCFTSHEFYTLIADAGRGAGNKRIPSFVFQLPFTLQKIVLEGCLSGDGYIHSRNKGTELAASTASRELAYGISRLIRNVYKTAVNISVSQPKESIIEGRVLHPNYPTYSIYATLNGKCSSTPIPADAVTPRRFTIAIMTRKEIPTRRSCRAIGVPMRMIAIA